tara:strand:- start:429 stop:764 length:336 start_codon:yes stop_codon:yes gene_type:complete
MKPGTTQKNMMNCYTIIAEYDGGTFVSQIPAEDRDHALRLWFDDGDPETSSSVHIHKEKRKRMDQLETWLFGPDTCPWSLAGCENVWQFLFTLGKKNGTIHIIKTSHEADD